MEIVTSVIRLGRAPSSQRQIEVIAGVLSVFDSRMVQRQIPRIARNDTQRNGDCWDYCSRSITRKAVAFSCQILHPPTGGLRMRNGDGFSYCDIRKSPFHPLFLRRRGQAQWRGKRLPFRASFFPPMADHSGFRMREWDDLAITELELTLHRYLSHKGRDDCCYVIMAS